MVVVIVVAAAAAAAAYQLSTFKHFNIFGDVVRNKTAIPTYETRMVQLPATAAIEYVAACCRTRTRTRTKTKIETITKTARSPQVLCVYEPSRLSVPSIVA